MKLLKMFFKVRLLLALMTFLTLSVDAKDITIAMPKSMLAEIMSQNITNAKISDDQGYMCRQACKKQNMNVDMSSVMGTDNKLTCSCNGDYKQNPYELERINPVYKVGRTLKKYGNNCDGKCKRIKKVVIDAITVDTVQPLNQSLSTKESQEKVATLPVVCVCGDKPKNYAEVMHKRSAALKK